MKNISIIQKIIELIDLPTLLINRKKQIILNNSAFINLIEKTDISKNRDLLQRIENFINNPENFINLIKNPIDNLKNLFSNQKILDLVFVLENIGLKLTHFSSFNISMSEVLNSNIFLSNVYIFRLFTLGKKKLEISKNNELFIVFFDLNINNLLDHKNSLDNLQEVNKKYTFLLQVANRVFSTVKGFSETILSSKYQDLKIIYNMIKIIDDEVSKGIKILLSFNLSNNIENVNIQKTNVVEILNRIIEKYKSQILSELKNLELNYYVQPNIPLVNTDPSKLELCLLNILDNSVRFRDENKDKQWIKVEAFFESSINKIFIIIQDNGIGMTQDEISKLGNLFQTFSDKSGIGLGMYIVYKIVKYMDWEIKIESIKNQYTKITLIISYV